MPNITERKSDLTAEEIRRAYRQALRDVYNDIRDGEDRSVMLQNILNLLGEGE